MIKSANRVRAKAARRVIEILEYFTEDHRSATVMDIARRYNRPQSSTSELMAGLVELGVLYKSPTSRSYTLTPRAAILGSLSQPPAIRDGTLLAIIDQLVARTGLCAALVGAIGVNAQIFRWSPGSQLLPDLASPAPLAGGVEDQLQATAAGWLLLSTIEPVRRDRMLRQLSLDAPEHLKFDRAEISNHVRNAERLGYAIGPAGFGSTAEMCAVLLQQEFADRPMVISFVYRADADLDRDELVGFLKQGASWRDEWANRRFAGHAGSPYSKAPMPQAIYGRPTPRALALA